MVTGGSRGIGRGIILKLAEQGATVALNYIKDEVAADQTLSKIRELDADGFVVQADVAEPNEVKRMIEQVRQQFGQLDIFVNNALGNLLGFMSPPMQVTIEQWDEAFQVQSRAFF